MIGLGSDHVGFELKQKIMDYLKHKKISYRDYGTYDKTRCNYPDYGYTTAINVANGVCEKGIIICGTGVGISLAANKVKGIRCVVCSEPYSALLSRNHNNTNMLAIGSRVVSIGLAEMILDVWLNGEFEGGRHAKRLEIIKQIEEQGVLDI